MGPFSLERLSGGYERAKDKAIQHYRLHEDAYDAAGAVAVGLGAYFAAENGIDATGAQEYLAASMPWFGHYADAVANGATGLLAAAGAKVPAHQGMKYLIGTTGRHGPGKGTAKSYGSKGSSEDTEGTMEEMLGEAGETWLAHHALGLPMGPSDVKEIYNGIKADARRYDARKAFYGIDPSTVPTTTDEPLDRMLDDMAAEARLDHPKRTKVAEGYGDYVDRLRDGMEAGGYSF